MLRPGDLKRPCEAHAIEEGRRIEPAAGGGQRMRGWGGGESSKCGDGEESHLSLAVTRASSVKV